MDTPSTKHIVHYLLLHFTAIILLLAYPAATLQAVESGGAQVEFFSPTGSTKDVRQVVARFTLSMVAFGDPRLADPFTITCPEPGRGRWADARNWVYDFDRDLPAGLRCSFTLKPELTALNSENITGAMEFGFDTGGPNIRVSIPYEGDENIDERQIFILGLDTAADPASVRAHAHCQVDGISELINVELLSGAERKKMLAEKRLLGYSYYRLLWKDGHATMAMESDDAFKRAEDELVVLRCQRTLPPGTQMQLVWDQGISATSGVTIQQAQKLAFRVRDSFKVRFECQRTNAQADCIPVLPMRVVFSAPVTAELAAEVRLIADNGDKYKPDAIDPVKTPTVTEAGFTGPFPERTIFKVHLPKQLQDDAGRVPDNMDRYPLQVATDEAPPLAKFSSTFGILELKSGGMLPVTLRNLESPVAARKLDATQITGKHINVSDNDAAIVSWMQNVEQAMASSGDWTEDNEGHGRWKETTGANSVLAKVAEAQPFTIPKAGNGKAFEVVGIPLRKSGFYVVELASPKLGAALLGESRPRYVATTALVTNLAVHFKWGRESSLVWVTTLDKARPVADAKVRISEYCSGRELWQGVTGLDGTARISGDKLPAPHSNSGCSNWSPSPLMVSARANDDMSFTVSSWSRGILPYHFNLPTGYESGADMAHTVMDRTLLRAGETVSMKHFYRRHTMSGIGIPAQVLDQLIIQHEGSDQRYTQDVSFDEQGTGESVWTIPADAKLGSYSITLSDKANQKRFTTGSFRVEQYRVPTMKALIQPPAAPLVNAEKAEVDLYVSYLSGGGAANAPVKLRTIIEPRSVSFRDYSDYSFGGKDVVTGLNRHEQEGYDDLAFFRSRFGDYQQRDVTAAPAQVIPVTLDANGSARVAIPNLPKVGEPRQITAELEYQDANGEMLSVSNRIALWPARINLGIRTEGWVASKDELRIRVVALDLEGKPAAGKQITVDLFQTMTYSYRKRLIGGFYAYENTRDTKDLELKCSGKTNAQGLIYCNFKPGISGSVTIRARGKDDLGNQALASRDTWLVGGDDWWFDAGDNDRIDVIPEKNDYETGDVARFQVRMPFRAAQALVTVEREGVIDSFITEISGREPVVEVPIKPEYSPNVYVSVLALRGRVSGWRSWLATISRKLELPWKLDGGLPTAMIDLSKPAYRLGIGQINVGWKPHRLDIAVTAEQQVYKVRDTARVKIAVTRADQGKLPARAEVAVAAVDEGLLELMPNNSWTLLESMMGKRGIEVFTSTAQMQVVGKRHYGRKAAPHGGGGGRQSARELFDTLLIWKGRVMLDKNGRADIEIPLNDSLTSFRIVAVAHAGAEHFGTGQTSIRTSQDLMVHSGLPGLVRENDQFNAIFTVRNASTRKITLAAHAQVSAEKTGMDALPEQQLALAPGESKDVMWRVTAPVNATRLSWEVEIQEQDGPAQDRMRIDQEVIPAYPVRTYQATLTRITEPLRMLVERPHDAVPGRGGINVTLRAQLGNGLDAVREYMSYYSYICYEQHISKAIALRDKELWQQIMNRTSSYLDRDGLLKYFPADWLQGSDTLTSYVLAIAHEAGWEIPQYERERMVRGLTGFAEGRVQRDSALQTADLSIRKLAAIEAISRYQTVSPALLNSVTLEPDLWPTSAVLDWINILKRVPDIAENAARMKEAQNVVRSRLNFQGTIMGFSTEHTDALWWLMISSDVNAVRGILNLLDQKSWHEDIPRMVRGAISRQHRGHWNTTTANAWGVLAMEKFSSVYESVPVTGSTKTDYAGSAHVSNWSETAAQDHVELPWADTRQSLSIAHSGSGVPWAIIQSRAALPLREPLFTGYKIVRTVIPVEQKQQGMWTRGDIARIRLEIDAQTDMTWVVVDDPVPAGAAILGTGLGRDSTILIQGEQRQGWVWPAYEERRFDAFRAYYHFVPKGAWVVEYTVRYNNPGVFALPATRVEAMYAPEMFGEMPNAGVEIKAAP